MQSSPRAHASFMRAWHARAIVSAGLYVTIVHTLTLGAQMTNVSRGASAALGILVATFLAFGAVEELVVRGIRGGELQPLVVGIVGAAVSVLLAVASVSLWRQHAWARRLAMIAAIAAIVFHAYAALPPHRNVGLLVLVVASLYGVMLLGLARGDIRAPRRDGSDVRPV
jgi:hypothetical protein